MALFRRNDGFDDMVQRLRAPGLDANELDSLLGMVLADPAATPRSLAWMLGAEPLKLRQAGLEFITAHAAADAADLVFEAYLTAPMQRRRELGAALLRLDRRAVGEALRRAFASQGTDSRSQVLEIVGYGFPVREALPLLKQAIRDGNPESLRRQAARLLRRGAQDPTIALLLRAVVHDEDDEVRSEAIHALCEHPSPDIVDPFFARLPLEGKELQNLMLETLGRLAQQQPSPQLEERVFAVLADDNPHIRRLAAQLIVRMPDPGGVLRRFLEQSRELAIWLRERATEALMQVASQLSAALAPLIHDPDHDVRMAAMLLAAKSNDPAIVPHLLEVFLHDRDWWTCSVAADILTIFPSPQVFAALMERVADPDLRYSVVSALGKLPSNEATQALLTLLADHDRSIRTAALRGLHGRTHSSVATQVGQLAAHDPEEQVREHALLALETLGEPGRRLLAAHRVTTIADQTDDTEPLTLEMANSALQANPGGSNAANARIAHEPR